MKNTFHVSVNGITIASAQTFELARDIAVLTYNRSIADTKVEVTRMSVIVWGPFIVGGKFKP